MHKNGIKILVVLTVTFLMAGCNGGGGSSSGVNTGAVSSTTEVPTNISEESIIATEVFTEDFNNQPLIEEPLYIPEEPSNTEELSTEVYTDITETTAPAANPEPATLTLLGIGAGLLAMRSFRKKK